MTEPVTKPSATATPETKGQSKRYRVTFLPMNVTVEVDEADYPFGDHGLPGSLLDIAMKHNIHIEHNCGGNCACTTCHVVVKEGGREPVHP